MQVTAICLHLFGDLCVANNATVRHCRRFPGRGVTGCAVSADLCMGCDSAQNFHVLCVQWSGVIDQAAACVSIARNNKNCDQGGKNNLCLINNPTLFASSLALLQESCVIQRRTDVDKCGNEQYHADWNVDRMPERQQPPRLFESLL